MRRITTKQAAQMMQISEQAVRMMIQLGRIPGASCGGTKARRSYFITDEQVKNLMKGARV
jgi:excisionase family DNA binding protein